VKHVASPSFWEAYEKLPSSIRVKADRRYQAVAIRTNDDVIWFWIGTHTDYDHLLK
jgi:hypothetical protein